MKNAPGRLISFLLVIFIIVSLMAGCAGKNGESKDTTVVGNSTAVSTSGTNSTAEKPVYPLDTDVTITYWNQMNPNVSARYTNMGDTPFAKELTARTGIKVKYIHSTTDESFSLLIASQDLPDIIEFWWGAYPGGAGKAVKDGVILPLSDIMDENAPNFAQWLKDNPEFAKQIRWDEGYITGFPTVNGSLTQGETRISQGLVLRQDLLDKLGLSVPETIDEWQTVLEGFKSLGVTAPYTLAQIYDYDLFSRAYGVQLPGNNSIYLENGKVVYGPVQPAFKDYLTLLNKWYKQGLLDKDIATNDDNLVQSKMLDGSAAATGSWIGTLATYNQTGPEKISGYKMAAAPLPVLKKGDVNKYSLVNNPYSTNLQAVITKSSKHPDIAARLLDYLWGEEGNTLANWGILDKTYTIGSDGKKHYTDFVKKNPDGWSVYEVKGGYSRSYASGPYHQDSGNLQLESFAIPEQFTASDLWSKNMFLDHLMPPIRSTAEEDEEYSKIMTDVGTHYSENALKFILGNRSLNDFDKYIAEMKDLKTDRAMEIKQAAYDRYLKR